MSERYQTNAFASTDDAKEFSEQQCLLSWEEVRQAYNAKTGETLTRNYLMKIARTAHAKLRNGLKGIEFQGAIMASSWNKAHAPHEDLKRLPSPVRCNHCRALVVEVMRNRDDNTCLQCAREEEKTTTNRPFRALALTLLILLGGCAVPREFQAKCNVANQQLEVRVMR